MSLPWDFSCQKFKIKKKKEEEEEEEKEKKKKKKKKEKKKKKKKGGRGSSYCFIIFEVGACPTVFQNSGVQSPFYFKNKNPKFSNMLSRFVNFRCTIPYFP